MKLDAKLLQELIKSLSMIPELQKKEEPAAEMPMGDLAEAIEGEPAEGDEDAEPKGGASALLMEIKAKRAKGMGDKSEAC